MSSFGLETYTWIDGCSSETRFKRSKNCCHTFNLFLRQHFRVAGPIIADPDNIYYFKYPKIFIVEKYFT